MAKRGNAVAAIEALSDISIGNTEVKDRYLASIPAPIWTDPIPWNLVYSDRTFNVRDYGQDGAESSYLYEGNEGLYHSLKELGLETRGSDNMSFSYQGDGRYLVIGGNLRHAMMCLIRENVTKDDPAATLPFEAIKGLVFTGLTRDQEIALMADHTMKKGLNEFELCKEVGVMMHRLKLTDEQAAIKFGIEKSSIARLRMRYAMPTVMGEYRKQKADPVQPHVKVTQKALTLLYTNIIADQKAGCEYRQEGMNFANAWKEWKSNPDSLMQTPIAIKSRKRDDIVKTRDTLSGTFGNLPEVDCVKEVLAWSANEEIDGKPLNLQTVVMQLKDYCTRLRDERDSAVSLAEEHASRLEILKSINNALTLEIENYKSHVSDLESEINSLKTVEVK